MDDDKTITPGSLCLVVRNTTGHPCIERDIGRPVKVPQREMALDRQDLAFGIRLFGFIPIWTVAEHKCPHCGHIRCGYPEADLQKMRGPRLGQDKPAERPVVIDSGLPVLDVGIDMGRPATADEAARMLEALR